jgi:hypothetical protein
VVTGQSKRFEAGMFRRREMHQVIIFKEKDGLKVYRLDYDDAPNVVANRVLSQRLAEGWYGGAEVQASEALKSGRAYDFLLKRSRQRHEYETFDVLYPIDARCV